MGSFRSSHSPRLIITECRQLAPAGLPRHALRRWLRAPVAGDPLARRLLEPLALWGVRGVLVEDSGVGRALLELWRSQPTFGILADLMPSESLRFLDLPRMPAAALLGASQSLHAAQAPTTEADPKFLRRQALSRRVRTDNEARLVQFCHRSLQRMSPSDLNTFGLWRDGVLLGPGVRLDPQAEIAPRVTIGSGSSVAAGARIGSDTIVGNDCWIGRGAQLDRCLILDDAVVPAGTIASGGILWGWTRNGRKDAWTS